MSEIVRDFCHGDRYGYDFNLCTTAKGFAQVDTGQDAWYFGTWANPFKLCILCYCEGDVTLTKCKDEKEFSDELHKIKKWNFENGWGFFGIDPGFNEKLRARFGTLGLASMLH